MRLEDLHYELPEHLIAQHPAERRDQARLMVVDPGGAAPHHASIAALPELLPVDAVVVVNDTRVRKARLVGHKPSGGRAELLLVRPLPEPGMFSALGRARRALRPGTRIDFSPGLRAFVDGRDEEGFYRVLLEDDSGDLDRAIEAVGLVPLPPYVRRPPDAGDEDRYQTVYARVPGAVAAPTAGLHLTEPLLAGLRARGTAVHAVTLHVGPGTFAPVTVDDLDHHPMHAEVYHVPPETAVAVNRARAAGRPIVAIGTTVVRTLESAWRDPDGLVAGPGETRLLLQPGARFRAVDVLLTNFHLPRSTLLALVMAFAGEDVVRAAYAEAIARGYRFFSYGDAMLLR